MATNITPVETELRDFTGLKPKAKEPRQAFLKRLAEAVSDKADEDWDKLSNDAQVWSNDADQTIQAGDDEAELPDFNAKANGAANAEDAAPDEQQEEAVEGDESETIEKSPKPKGKSKPKAKVAAKNGKAAAPKSAKPKVVKVAKAKGSGEKKVDIIFNMLTSKKGATAKELMDACGWTKISVSGQAAALGLKLKTQEEGRGSRFFGTPIKAPSKK